jgi:hypothetical protein
MPPDPHDLDAAVPRPPSGPNPQPGLIFGVCSIAAGVVGFSVPVLGMVASCVGIWFGIKAMRQSRAADYRPSITCGRIGISLCVLGIIYWICAVLFESYR